MFQDLLAKYDRRVPRYTSYPTAPQFAPKVRAADYRAALRAGGLPVARGLRLDHDDRLRGAVIERLMCFLEVDLDEVCRGFGAHPGVFADALSALAVMEADGVVALDGARVRVTERGRPFVRTVCAAFDRYLEPGETRHAQAV